MPGTTDLAPDDVAGALEFSDCPASGSGSWNDALSRLPGASWYHRYEWRSINEDGLGHRCIFLRAERGGRIVGLLPLTFLSTPWFGRMVCSMPFVNSGGPCAEEPDIARLLLAKAAERAAEFGARYVELRGTQPVDCSWSLSQRKVSMVIPLENDSARAWDALPRKLRTQVRKAGKDGAEVISGGEELLPEFCRVMERAWRDLGTPLYAGGHFERVLRAFPDAARIFVCRRGGRAVATALNGYFGGVVEGLWNGCTRDGRAAQANYVLYWEMIRDAVDRGFRTFHLGRSTVNSGAVTFKRKWNAVEHPLYWYYWLPDGGRLPDLNVDNPRYRYAIAAWKRLPLFATRVIGPSLARCIP